MVKSPLYLIITATTLMSCHRENKAEAMGDDNPLLATWDTPYQTPPFELIKNEHFKPALEEAMRIQQGEIAAIANNHASPNFKNTIVALENTGTLLTRINTVLSNLSSAHTNDTLQALAQEMAPQLSKHSDDIYLNEKLFAKVKTVWDNQISFKLNTEDTKLLEKKYKAFIRSGANLAENQKVRLRKINEELSV
ncbi:MAG: peptidase M3, partial [Bacteroidota bacterium]